MLPVYMGSAYIARTTQHHTRARARNGTRHEQLPETAESSERDTREPEHNAKAEMPRQTRARRRRLHWRDAKRHEAENPFGSRKRNEPEQRPRARVLSAQREPEHNAKAEMPRQEKARRRQSHWRDAQRPRARNPKGPENETEQRPRARVLSAHIYADANV